MSKKSGKKNPAEEGSISRKDISKLTDQLQLLWELRSVENHLGHSALLSVKDDSEKAMKFLKLKGKVREIRTFLLEQILGDKKSDYEEWCIFKHLSGSIEIHKELADREVHNGSEELAEKFIEHSSNLLNIFLSIYDLMMEEEK